MNEKFWKLLILYCSIRICWMAWGEPFLRRKSIKFRVFAMRFHSVGLKFDSLVQRYSITRLWF